jgi:hypothetical protein
MPSVRSQHCRGPECQSQAGQTDQQYQQELAVFLATLNHAQRRLYAAVEANRLGHGGVGRVVELTGMCNQTVARGRRELSDLLQGKSLKKKPHPVGGRPRTEEKYPAITAALDPE